MLTIHYDPAGPAPTSIYYLDPVNGPTKIAGTIDLVAHTISAALPHFSDYVAGDDPPIDGTTGADTFTLLWDGTNMVLHPTSGTDTTVAAGQHDAVTVHLLAGDDHLSLTIGDLGAYDGALTIDGGADTDTLTVTSDENMTLSAGQLLAAAARSP